MTQFLHTAQGVLSSGQPWSIRGVSSGNVTEAAAEAAWGGAWHTFWSTAGIAALWSTHFSFTLSTTSTASATFGQTTITRTTHTDAGTATTQELPDYCSLVVTYRTGTADKSAHGRWFIPAPVGAALSIGTGGHLSSGTETTIQTALNAWFSTFTGDGLALVILTRRATRHGLAANSFRTVSSADFPNTLHVQKRRGDKVPGSRTTVTV